MNPAPKLLEVHDFARGLEAIANGKLDYLAGKLYVQSYAIEPESLERYVLYRASHYTRNLIHRCESFEMLTICWESGQRSPIHNHDGQNCWMVVPIGRLQVLEYDLLSQDAETARCELRFREELLLDQGNPGAVDPARPIHAVINPIEWGARATSVHIYSRPYDRCLTYSLERGTYQQIPLDFTSEWGVLNE